MTALATGQASTGITQERADSIARLTIDVWNMLTRICEDHGIDVKISKRVLVEVCMNFNKEIDKLKVHQNDTISITKRIVALTFWIRRLKPIYLANKRTNGIEIADINEQATIWITTRLLVDQSEVGNMPSYYINLSLEGKSRKFSEYIQKFWSMEKYCNYFSFVYALRSRNISPHHLALYLDGIISGFVLKYQP